MPFSVVHEEQKPFLCNICKSKFPLKCTLSKHMNMFTWEKPIKCENCDVAFGDTYKLKKHMTTVHKEKRLFECNICNDTFKSKLGLDGHGWLLCIMNWFNMLFQIHCKTSTTNLASKRNFSLEILKLTVYC